VKSRLPLTSFCLVMTFSLSGWMAAQTFEVNGQGNSSPQKQTESGSSQNGSNLSWGASIQVARQARAADAALKRNDYVAAIQFAQQAAKSAPQDPELWFLLGYAARLGEKYPLSIDAYNRGLKLKPSSAQGMAGLAQTYAKMGRDQEAEQLLMKVVNQNPRDANSLQLAGELLLNTDPNRAVEFLQRSDSIQGSAHTELMLAHGFERIGKPDQASQYISRAKNRAPHDPEVLRAVAEQYRENGQYDQAIAALQAIPNKNTDALADLAYTYEMAGRKQDAATLYSRIAKAAKGNIGLETRVSITANKERTTAAPKREASTGRAPKPICEDSIRP